jgi:hypothetical protein
MRVKNLTQNRWHINIHHMLQRISSIAEDDLHLYFDLISKKLQLYNTLKDVPALLELVMWKLSIVTNLMRIIFLTYLVRMKKQTSRKIDFDG